MVEVAQFWFNRFRKRLVRYEKRHRNNLALIHVAAATIALRKIGFIMGKFLVTMSVGYGPNDVITVGSPMSMSAAR